MNFNLINIDDWHRKEYYNHYMNNVVCTYSITVNIDITNIGTEKLYPKLLWLLTDTVNEMEQFRTSLAPQGVGIFEYMHPSYTIFNKENESFSVIWTEFDKDFDVFIKRYNEDVKKYQHSTSFSPKENKPINTFDVSMLPWTTFTSFNINVYDDGHYLLPIFTIGKAKLESDRTFVPLAIQVHHAVCDGYHVSKFVDRLQSKIDKF